MALGAIAGLMEAQRRKKGLLGQQQQLGANIQVANQQQEALGQQQGGIRQQLGQQVGRQQALAGQQQLGAGLLQQQQQSLLGAQQQDAQLAGGLSQATVNAKKRKRFQAKTLVDQL